MKLLVDCHCFDAPSSEGMNTYIKGLYSEAVKLAPDIDFFFAGSNQERLHRIFGEAPNVHYVKMKPTGRTRRLLTEYPRLIHKLGIDWAHFQYFHPFIKNCKTIVTLHDVLYRDYPELYPRSYRLTRNIIFGHAAHSTDVLATVSDYSRCRISEIYRIPQESITVTPNAVAEEFFTVDREAARQEIHSRGIRPYILNISRIEPRKNQLALVRAYNELDLAHRGYDLVLINRESIAVPELERYIAQLAPDVRSRVHRMEGLPHESVKLWYAGASLFVFPSLGEGFGIPPLEAGATLTPTICNNMTALADYDMFGENLADLTVPDKLNELIMKNLTEPPGEQELKGIADEIRRRYSWRESASRILERLKP